MESRTLFSAPAHVVAVYADNRGEVEITFDKALRRSTINTRSVFILTAGPDDKFGTADDARVQGIIRLVNGGKRIRFRPTEKLPFVAGTTYSIKVRAKTALDADGNHIDGEFNGPGKVGGDGQPFGDFICLSKRNKTNLIARFSTIAGNIDVKMFTTVTPKNAFNFLSYADNGDYDNLFINRDLKGFIFQTGGWVVTPQNGIAQVTSRGLVDNEPSVTHATRGTISLARPDDKNPATDDKGSNEFFFNLVDNEANLGAQNGGFTEFGEVTTASGLAVMDQIANFPTINASGGDPNGVFANLAVQNGSTTVQQASADPQGTLVTIRRIAVRNLIVSYPVL